MERVQNRRMTDYSELSADDIEEMAHEEDIEDTIFVLKSILERLLNNQENISLSELQTDGGIDRISAFLALLFLAARGEVDMHQENFYEELYVSKLDEEDLINEVETTDQGKKNELELEEAG